MTENGGSYQMQAHRSRTAGPEGEAPEFYQPSQRSSVWEDEDTEIDPHSQRSTRRECYKAVGLDQSNQRPTTSSDVGSGSTRQKKDIDAQLCKTKLRQAFELSCFGWWWEFGAVVVSLVATTLIMAILLVMNGKPLQHWRLPIQINSLVAIFSTFARSSLLLVLAEGLSQLKWNHFEKQSSTLNQLQTFDEASRGPWGALMLLVKLKREIRCLSAIGAALTVLGLAFEPFTQQILEFPSRKVSITNGTAHVYAAQGFALREWSREWSQDTKHAGPTLTIMRSIIDLLPNPSARIDSHFVCPTGDCEMKEHWSLAACVDCKHYFLDQDALECTYYSSRESPEHIDLEELKKLVKKSGSMERPYATCNTDNSSDLVYVDSYETPLPRFNISQSLGYDWNTGETDLYNLFIGKSQEKYTTDRMVTISSVKTSGFPKLEDVEDWPGVTVNRTRCEINYCVKDTASTTINKGRILNDNIYREVKLNFSNACGNDADCPYINATFRPYTNETLIVQIDTEFRTQFGFDLEELIAHVMDVPLLKKYFEGLESPDIAEMMGTVLSSFMRSSQNEKATNITGDAISMETYVHVKWEWAIFPFIIVLGTVVFLVLILFESRSKEQLFKSSGLVGFLVRWEGAPESRLGKEKQYHYKDLLKEGEESSVRLTKKEDGEMRFVSTGCEPQAIEA